MHYKTCQICGLRAGRVVNEKREFMAHFPLDEDRCKEWVRATGKEDLAYVPIEKLHQLKYICGKHFLSTDFRNKMTQLNNSAVPTVLIAKNPLSDEILKDFPLHVASNRCNRSMTDDSELKHVNTRSVKPRLRVDRQLFKIPTQQWMIPIGIIEARKPRTPDIQCAADRFIKASKWNVQFEHNYYKNQDEEDFIELEPVMKEIEQYTPTKYGVVCKDHFDRDDYETPRDSILDKPKPMLKKNAVPSKFAWDETTFDPLNHIKRERRQPLNRDIKKVQKKRGGTEKKLEMYLILYETRKAHPLPTANVKQPVPPPISLAVAKEPSTLPPYTIAPPNPPPLVKPTLSSFIEGLGDLADEEPAAPLIKKPPNRLAVAAEPPILPPYTITPANPPPVGKQTLSSFIEGYLADEESATPLIEEPPDRLTVDAEPHDDNGAQDSPEYLESEPPESPLNVSLDVQPSFGRCRCCLSHGHLKSMWLEYKHEDTAEVYGDMIVNCFALSFEPTGESVLADKICDSCITRLRDATCFRKMLLESQDALMNLAYEDIKSEDGTLPDEEHIEEQVEEHIEEHFEEQVEKHVDEHIEESVEVPIADADMEYEEIEFLEETDLETVEIRMDPVEEVNTDQLTVPMETITPSPVTSVEVLQEIEIDPDLTKEPQKLPKHEKWKHSTPKLLNQQYFVFEDTTEKIESVAGTPGTTIVTMVRDNTNIIQGVDNKNIVKSACRPYEKKLSKKQIYVCDECGDVFTTNALYSTHCLKHSNEQYKCGVHKKKYTAKRLKTTEAS